MRFEEEKPKTWHSHPKQPNPSPYKKKRNDSNRNYFPDPNRTYTTTTQKDTLAAAISATVWTSMKSEGKCAVNLVTSPPFALNSIS